MVMTYQKCLELPPLPLPLPPPLLLLLRPLGGGLFIRGGVGFFFVVGGLDVFGLDVVGDCGQLLLESVLIRQDMFLLL